ARFGLAPVDSMARPEILAGWLQFTEKHALLLSGRRNPSQPSGPDFTSPQKALIAHVLIGKPVPTFPGHALGSRKPGPPQSMLAKRIVPLIVAVALFMENMDSTVTATSLPAIAADIGTNPLALKLAVTSYLLSLAVFIPVSGWTADRFGARTVFRGAIAVFMLGSIGCALSGSLTQFVAARIIE